MKLKRNQTWLFAFTDLAFLLLISLSLIPSAPGNIFIHFSEMNIPVVPSNENMVPLKHWRNTWELQVCQKSKDHPTPFKLVNIGMSQEKAGETYSKYVDRDNLIRELEELMKLDIRPILLPEKTSLSQDFLFAAGAIANVWASVNTMAVVRPIIPEGLQR
jgi:hypothetical protein